MCTHRCRGVVHWRDQSMGVRQVEGVLNLTSFVGPVVTVIGGFIRHGDGTPFLPRGRLKFSPLAGGRGDADGIIVVGIGVA